MIYNPSRIDRLRRGVKEFVMWYDTPCNTRVDIVNTHIHPDFTTTILRLDGKLPSSRRVYAAIINMYMSNNTTNINGIRRTTKPSFSLGRTGTTRDGQHGQP